MKKKKNRLVLLGDKPADFSKSIFFYCVRERDNKVCNFKRNLDFFVLLSPSLVPLLLSNHKFMIFAKKKQEKKKKII